MRALIHNMIFAPAIKMHQKTIGRKGTQPAQRRILILTAFGCGAYKNYPEYMADRFTDVLKEYGGPCSFLLGRDLLRYCQRVQRKRAKH